MVNCYYRSFVWVLLVQVFAVVSTDPYKISSQSLENLSIVSFPNGTQRSLDQMLNGCKTKSGQEQFRRSLTEITSNISTLRRRQQYITGLAKDKNTVEQVEQMLTECGTIEKQLAWPQACDTKGKEFYFSPASFFMRRIAKIKKNTPEGVSDTFNKNSAILTASYWSHYASLMMPTLYHVVLHVTLSSKSSCNSHDHHDHNKKTWWYYPLTLWHWAEYIATIPALKRTITNSTEKIQVMQQEVAQMKLYIMRARVIYDHLKKNSPDLIHEHAPVLEQLFHEQGNHPMRDCIQRLSVLSWDSPQQRWIRPGEVLAMYAEIRTYEPVLISLREQLGAIDAYINVAKLLINQTVQEPYCLVRFEESGDPVLQAKQLRHHAIPVKNMRPIDISLSAKNPILILKGENGVGKTVTLTTLGQAISLGLSWSIAPAEHFVCSPIESLHTHNVKRDKIEEGKSHFYYECGNYETMLEKISQNTQGALVLLDEPYSCTHHQKGAYALAALLEKLKKQKLALSIIATHLPLDTMQQYSCVDLTVQKQEEGYGIRS